MDRDELGDHPGAPWVVERLRQLLVSISNQPEEIQVALMMTPRGVSTERLDLFEDALAELLEGHVAKLAKGLPV